MGYKTNTKIIFGGDFYIDDNDNREISQEILNLFKKADYSILNLEAPISDKKIEKYPKAGPSLIQSEKAINLLKKINVKYVSGANNHIIDYGDEGIKETMNNLSKNGIKFGGFGLNKEEAKKPMSLGDSNIVIISTAEEEFGVAEANKAGIYSMYGDEIIEQISSLNSSGKIVIVFAHGGGEKIPLPSNYIINRYKQFIDAGAQSVVAHHPHVIQGIINYKDKPIFFSLGNFIHSYHKEKFGLLAVLEIDNARKITYEIKLLNPNDGQNLEIIPNTQIETYLSRSSKALNDSGIFNPLIQEQSFYMYKKYYRSYFESIFKKSYNLKNIMIEKIRGNKLKYDSLLLLHLLRNKSHKEFIETALKLIANETEDVRSEYSITEFKYLNEFCN